MTCLALRPAPPAAPGPMGWAGQRRAGPRAPRGGRALPGLFALLALWLSLLAWPAQADNNVEVLSLELQRDEAGLYLDFSLRVRLPRGVEDALTRGVPVYFVAQASVYRPRWYWRDARVARATRSWRVSYQPLTGGYRVGLGALSQSYPTLEEAMLAVTRLARWPIAAADQLEPDARHYVEFSWRMDSSQLPRPLQIGTMGQGEWALDVERTMRLEPQP